MSMQFKDAKAFREWNEAMAAANDPESFHLRSSPLIRWIEARRVRTLLTLLKATSKHRVLEVGVGAGNVLEQVPGGRLLGLDLSSFLLNKARARLQRLPSHLLFASAEELPFADTCFERVYCTEVIEHVQHPERLIREMARVATDDAVLVITIPNEAIIDRLKEIVRRLGLSRWIMRGSGTVARYDSPENNDWHLHHFNLPMLREMAAEHLCVETVKAVPCRLLPIRYVVAFRSRKGQAKRKFHNALR